MKVNSEKSDAHQDWSLGRVLGSIKVPENNELELAGVRHFYFIEWESDPKMAVGIVDYKVMEVRP